MGSSNFGTGSQDTTSKRFIKNPNLDLYQQKTVSFARPLTTVVWGNFNILKFRYLTGECDKTIKVYKEDEDATPQTHPLTDYKIEYDRQMWNLFIFLII